MGHDKTIKEEAKKLYQKGLSLKVIAEQLGIKDTTLRSWKCREKWVQYCNVATERNVATKQTQKVMESEEALTDKQELFCLLFSRSLNATKSYQEAFGCAYNSAMVNSSRLLKKPHIKKEVERLKKERYTLAYLSVDDIFQKYMDIAFSDIGDYLEFNEMEVEGEKKNIVLLKNSKEVDTSLLQEVKEGREGVSVKLHDKMKALEWLAGHMDMATEEQRARVEKIKADTEKVNAEIANLKGLDAELEDLEEIEGAIYGKA